MKLHFWAIGRDHESFVEEGVNDFTKRITNYFPVSWKIFSSPKNQGLLSKDDLKKKEGELILKTLSQNDFLVALDERGKMIDSGQLATLLQARANESLRNCIFLIGGAYGIDQQVTARANFIWSLSALTFPHQLVRLILAEQVYRACTILRNEKYHHS
jgi:23S rRNA (pseudouridine1915-N3)-methyltransferase